MRLVAERAEGNQDTDKHEIEDLHYQLIVAPRQRRRRQHRACTARRARCTARPTPPARPRSARGNCAPTASTSTPRKAWASPATPPCASARCRCCTCRGSCSRSTTAAAPACCIPSISQCRSATASTGKQPIYLNLAPNYDATLTPRYMSERGAMLGGEFRYLYEQGRRFRQLDAERQAARGRPPLLLTDGKPIPARPCPATTAACSRFNALAQPRSALAGTRQPGLDQRHRTTSRTSATACTAVARTPRAAQRRPVRPRPLLGRRADGRPLAARRLHADRGSLPYNRLPRPYVHWDQPFGALVRRRHRCRSRALPARQCRDGGSRVDLKPYVSMPLEGASWFVKPTLAWRYTGYQLDDDARCAPRCGDSSRRRAAACRSPALDAGLFFDRDTEIDGERLPAHAGTAAVLPARAVSRPGRPAAVRHRR